MPDADALPVPPAPVDAAAELEALAQRYLRANGALMQVVTYVGGQVENALERLPDAAKDRIDEAARVALAAAYAAARVTHRPRRTGDAAHRAAATVLGAAGGFGGLPSALAELPVTTTAILRSIQEIAAEHGEDLTREETRLECLRVFGTGGPLAEDDGTDFAFLGARLTLTGPAMHRLIAGIAPRFAAVIGQKLAAQAVPVLGAVAGAGANLAFTRYYQEMAHVHFGLRRLARGGAIDAQAAFRTRVEAGRRLRRA